MEEIEILHGHICCGLAGGAKGFNAAEPRVGNLKAKFRCLGGIDVDPAAIRDFNKLAGVPGTVMDLFDRQQYIDFHGHQPQRSGARRCLPTSCVLWVESDRTFSSSRRRARVFPGS